MSNHQNQHQTGSGLTRYRSAPSSYFSNILNTAGFGAEDYEQLFNPRATSPETQRIFSRFVGNNSETIQENSSVNVYAQTQSQLSSQFLSPMNNETVVQQQPQQQLQRQQSNDYSSVSHQIMYQDINSGEANSSYGTLLGSNRVGQMKMEGGGSGLIRQSSSPAGLLANINIEKEFGAVRGKVDFGAAGSTSNDAEASFSSTSRFNSSQIDFSSSSRHSSSSSGMMMMMMAPISENGNRRIKENNPGEPQFEDAWDDSALFSDNFLNGFSDPNASDDQSNEGGSRTRARLAHHLSMPTSSAELSGLEKLLQDSVPCKIRAKRGFATHPRSIAERVRRTKISERMRRLQELVPNMEKQTNTSDMLDLAVDYIKDLQSQVTKLSDTRGKCSCLPKEKS